jgi:crotonobetainyl-CoA:carnitine CoA-transferase CaiB-like acyl-CoA transferase
MMRPYTPDEPFGILRSEPLMTQPSSNEHDSALGDIRVLDLAGEIGQYATKLLADLGAEVIKVEPPGGDPVRALPPNLRKHPEQSLYWLNLNTNKRSITLDIASDDGRKLLRRLAETADVVVESFEPGYLTSLGLGYDDLSRDRPGLIFTSITGFGQTGPHAKYKAPDIVGVAMGGIMWLAGEPMDPPNVPPWRQGYISASIMGAAGTLTALFHRDRTGQGQHVDVSMQEALSLAQETAMQTWDMNQALRVRSGSRGIIPFDIPGIGVYECSDGHVFGYLGTPGGAPWTAMLEWMVEEGKAENLNESPYREFIENLNLRFLTSIVQDPSTLGEKIQKMGHMAGVLRRFTASKTKWEMYEEGQRRRLLWGIVSTPEDIAKKPQLEYRQWLAHIQHPEINETLPYPGPPYRLSETPWAIRMRPPLIGEHNSEIYGNELGITPAEWQRLESQGVV